MSKNKSNLLTLAKYINREILIEDLIRAKGLTADSLLTKYSKKKKRLKLKATATKLFYSIIFGILPVIPLMTYFEMQDSIISQGLSIHIVFFSGSLLFLFFFALQFINIFFMGMIEVSSIISNPIFLWLETLPLSSKKLSKLKLLSIFRNFDLPLIVMTLGFPLTMLIGTFNLLLFLVSLGISVLNITLSFSVLIKFGNWMNKISNMSIANSRKTMTIRLINIFGYVIIFFGSLFFVQWAITSIDVFFRIPIVQEQPGILNLILCTIPYPFSSGYLIAFVSFASPIHYHFWIGIFCGLGLFVIIIWWIFTKSVSGLNRITTAKGETLKKYLNSSLTDKISIKIRNRSEIFAHFIKDLIITFRNIKVFLSAVTPIIISFVFTYTFNFTVLGGQTPLDTDFIYNLTLILALQPFICGMLIYNLLNLEGSGTPLFTSLPINPNKQAKAKLLFLLILQTISVISPYFIYIFQPGFIDLLLTILISLPYAWFVLISMFQLHIFLFGRAKHRFVLEPVHPDNRMIKTAFIYILEYILYIIIISMGIVSNFYGVHLFLSNFGVVLIIFYTILLFSFKAMFPSKPKLKNGRLFDSTSIPILSNWLQRHHWLSVTLLLLLNFSIVCFGNLTLKITSEMPQIIRFQLFYWYMMLPTLFAALIKTNIVPKNENAIRLNSTKSKIIIWSVFTTIFVLLYNLFFVNVFSIPYPLFGMDSLRISFYGVLGGFIFAIWNEILFRGIFYSLLLTKYSRVVSLWLSTCIFIMYFLLYNLFLTFVLGITLTVLDLLYIIGINIFLTYQFSTHDNILPALLAHFVSALLGAFPLFYFGVHSLFFI
ncbi:MAG: CPBP family glutamic-type intramembrane protease [Promethearchaeota archaeon]|jgi:hypothetical protein